MDEEVRRRQVELERDGVRRLLGVVDPLELALHPLPREAEPLDQRRLDEGREVVEDEVGVEVDAGLDETFVADVMETRKDNSARIYCLSMGEKSSATAMQEIATKTGGVFRLVPREELQSVTR